MAEKSWNFYSVYSGCTYQLKSQSTHSELDKWNLSRSKVPWQFWLPTILINSIAKKTLSSRSHRKNCRVASLEIVLFFPWRWSPIFLMEFLRFLMCCALELISQICMPFPFIGKLLTFCYIIEETFLESFIEFWKSQSICFIYILWMYVSTKL